MELIELSYERVTKSYGELQKSYKSWSKFFFSLFFLISRCTNQAHRFTLIASHVSWRGLFFLLSHRSPDAVEVDFDHRCKCMEGSSWFVVFASCRSLQDLFCIVFEFSRWTGFAVFCVMIAP